MGSEVNNITDLFRVTVVYITSNGNCEFDVFIPRNEFKFGCMDFIHGFQYADLTGKEYFFRNFSYYVL